MHLKENDQSCESLLAIDYIVNRVFRRSDCLGFSGAIAYDLVR